MAESNQLSFALKNIPAATHLFDVIPSFKLLKKENSFLGFLVTLNFVLNNQRKFWNLLNAVA